MNAQVKAVFEQIKQTLTSDERIELADWLYADTAVPNEEWEAAWAAEARRRLAAYERGEIEAFDADEVLAELDRDFGLK